MGNYLKILLSGFFYGFCLFPYGGGQIRKSRYNTSLEINKGQEDDIENMNNDLINIKSYFDKSISKIS